MIIMTVLTVLTVKNEKIRAYRACAVREGFGIYLSKLS